jgi:ribosomal protein S18 acetylase RimI-like enzyme
VTVVSVVEAVAADIDSWLLLVAEVEPLFGPMPDFHLVLLENIKRRSALVVRDESGAVAGALLLATVGGEGRVTWLAVRAEYRRHGIAGALVREAIGRLADVSVVSVVSFGPDVLQGQAARHLYEHLGFTAGEMVTGTPAGASRQRFRLALDR